jgi:hypothetical protein
MAKPHTAAEIEEWNQMMLTRGPSSPESQAHFNRLRDAAVPTRKDVTAWADLQDLEEGRPVPEGASGLRDTTRSLQGSLLTLV